ncbi:response regulator [Eubacteriales bacterium OttesenSCG-928-K08]|nr:response regulator [Eubacteriales bacterium OttesenSCG-928-K08]
MPSPYQVFVAEDEMIVREGIRNCLENSESFSLCGEAEDGEMALSAILELKPDILVTDIKMPFMDGLSLSRAVRRALPWVKILIISGYDEFDFAKQAISIGVAEYLLKPFDAKMLLDTLRKIEEQIEAERVQTMQANTTRLREHRDEQVLKDAFLDSLLTGAHDTADAMELAASYEIDLPAKKYLAVAVDLQIDSAPGVSARLRDEIEEALAERNDVLWCLRGSDRLALIIKGETNEQLDDITYELLIILQERLKRTLNLPIVSAIGSVVERVGAIASSYQNAFGLLRGVSGLPAGTVINFGDVQSGAASFVPLSAPVSQRLRHATPQDVDDILLDLRSRFSDVHLNSVLYGYYWLMDLLMAAARVVEELGGDAHAVFPELDDAGALLRASSSEQALISIARDMLERFLAFRGGAQDDHYGSVIARAKEYLYEHYGESDLSLNSVAAYCGFSPNHFSSMFSLHTGETFIGFLTRVRMEQAKKLLLETDKRSADVAFAVGYQDANYFRFLFKKHMGVSPRELRSTSE